MKKILLTVSIAGIWFITNAQIQSIILDPKEVQEQENPVIYIQNLYSKDTTDLNITSGPFHSQKLYKFSPEALDKTGFELIKKTKKGSLYRFSKENQLFQVDAYYGDARYFTITLKKFSKETAKKIPYLAYGCN